MKQVINCVAVIEYSLLSFRKVVRLKPDQPDRWLRPCFEVSCLGVWGWGVENVYHFVHCAISGLPSPPIKETKGENFHAKIYFK